MSPHTSADPRVARTTAAIRHAFANLLEDLEFETISVKDIASQAGINRGTFYLHYHDKGDLLRQIQMEVLQQFEAIIMEANTLQVRDLVQRTTPLPVVVELFRYFKRHARLMNALFSLKGDQTFAAEIRQALEKYLTKSEFLMGASPETFAVPSNYLIAYVLSAHLGVIQAWLRAGCRESPEAMATMLLQLAVRGPLHAMGVA